MGAVQTSLLHWYDRRYASPAAAIASWVRRFSIEGEDTKSVCSTSELDEVRLSRKGDGDAYRRLIERHQRAVAKLLWRFTRDRTEHEELTQQVFIEAYMSLAGYRAEAPFAHWLSRIATRVGYRYWKNSRRARPISLQDEALSQMPQPEENPARGEDAALLLHSLLARLPARDRLVLTLRYLDECDVRETAYRTGWTKTLVRVQTHRALKKLKKLAFEADIELE